MDDENFDEPVESEPAEMAPVTATGDYRVDVALSRVEELAGLPVAEHVAVYDDMHQQLQSALADLDER